MLSSAEVQVTGCRSLKTPNRLGERGSQLKPHHRRVLGPRTACECGLMLDRWTDLEGSRVAHPWGPEEPLMMFTSVANRSSLPSGGFPHPTTTSR